MPAEGHRVGRAGSRPSPAEARPVAFAGAGRERVITGERERARNRVRGVHVVSDRRRTGGRPLAGVAAAAARAGAAALHLREKDLPAAELLRLAREVAAAVRPCATLVLVNGRLDVALAAGADGVHLGRDALPVGAARRLAERLAGPGFLVGASVHSVEEARAAAGEGADYLLFGHVFETGSKPGLPGRGLEALAAVCAAVPVPVVAIGGLSPGNAAAARAAGAAGVAVLSAVMAAPDPGAAVRELRAAWDEGVESWNWASR